LQIRDHSAWLEQLAELGQGAGVGHVAGGEPAAAGLADAELHLRQFPAEWASAFATTGMWCAFAAATATLSRSSRSGRNSGTAAREFNSK